MKRATRNETQRSHRVSRFLPRRTGGVGFRRGSVGEVKLVSLEMPSFSALRVAGGFKPDTSFW